MSWEFSIGWFIFGVLILAAGTSVVVFHQKIAYSFANGANSFDRIKLFGIIAAVIGLLIMANLHTLILGGLVDLIFPKL